MNEPEQITSGLQEIAVALEMALDKLANTHVGFVLFVFPFNRPLESTIDYLSNAESDSVTNVLKVFLANKETQNNENIRH